jgi:3-oxoacyl-[acyl-carrier-protein] synthase II
VTGVGAVTALGPDSDSTFRRLAAGERAFSEVTLFDVSDQRVRIAAEISGLRVSDVAPRAEAESWSRTDALGVLAAREALASAGLRPGAPASLAVGASTGGMYEAESILGVVGERGHNDASVRRLLAYPISTTAERIAGSLGGVERAATLCSACSSGAVAIVQAAAWLASGKTERVLAGGGDGLCRLTFSGFNALGATDRDACRPFDARRAGLSLGEGAAFLVLETERAARARGARILAWLSGWAVLSEAYHITHPDPSGRTAVRLMTQALARAGRVASDVDYVNAHGTGTLQNDAAEGKAVREALGSSAERAWVSSLKGQVGHTLAAAGALEAVVTVLAIERGMVPPTGGLEVFDPAVPLRHVLGSGRRESVRLAFSNSFGFGGTGCVVVFEHAAEPDRRPVAPPPGRTAITGLFSLGPLGELAGDAHAAYAAPPAEPLPARLAREPLQQLDPARSRRFDRAAALVSAGVEHALADAGLAPEGVGIVAGSAFGNLERSVQFVKRLAERGARMASPAEFPHLVPSAPTGNASIYNGATGPVTSVADLTTGGEAAVFAASSFLELGLAAAMVAGAAEPYDVLVDSVLAPLWSRTAGQRSEGGAWLVLEDVEHAARRGARSLALLAEHAHASEPERAFVALPPPGDRALVVCAHVASELERALGASAWGGVRRVSVLGCSGSHEASGAFALAAAVALVARGQASEALACGGARGRVYVLRVIAAEASR